MRIVGNPTKATSRIESSNRVEDHSPIDHASRNNIAEYTESAKVTKRILWLSTLEIKSTNLGAIFLTPANNIAAATNPMATIAVAISRLSACPQIVPTNHLSGWAKSIIGATSSRIDFNIHFVT